MSTLFHDRREAGRLLAKKLKEYAHREDVVVLGLPRGGVPVAYEVAEVLEAPLDVCIVRKLGVPGHRELAMGAIASNGVRWLNYGLIRDLQISSPAIDEVAAKELRELQRRDRTYRGDRDPWNVENRCVIVVDDGLATGASMRAAIHVIEQQHPAQIIVAVPVSPRETVRQLAQEVTQVVCLKTPEPFHAIGLWYENFAQTSDEEVCQLLHHSDLPPWPNSHHANV
ncbi:MAG: phosphoribosyl transferase [Alkalinema sp. CACIAM 70d]|nr:MAG: phosphoribosyl transferase [Alkalinema sp. CACIAM 70d]